MEDLELNRTGARAREFEDLGVRVRDDTVEGVKGREKRKFELPMTVK